MTEKGYVYNVSKNTIEYNGKFIAYINSVDAYRIANKLNSLAEENEQLKAEAEVYNEDAMSYQTLYEQQVEKNKKLNQKLNIPEEQIDEVVLDGQLRVIAIYYKKENPIVKESKKRLTQIFEDIETIKSEENEQLKRIGANLEIQSDGLIFENRKLQEENERLSKLVFELQDENEKLRKERVMWND